MKERTAELEESVKELQTFAYTVSHDLRAPIRGMYRYAETLLSKYPGKVFDAQAEGFVANIASSAERMDLLVQDLLQYSRLTRAEMKLQDVALGPVVSGVLGSMDSEIKERKGRIAVDPHLPAVMGDPVMLAQALTNLVSNAIKFVPAGVDPTANIRAETQNGRVRLWVEDNGIGIASDLHGKLFQVFERLVKPDEYPGTGIGLAIVRKAVERMGGQVGLESQPGQGSRFWIDLPRVGTGLMAGADLPLPAARRRQPRRRHLHGTGFSRRGARLSLTGSFPTAWTSSNTSKVAPTTPIGSGFRCPATSCWI